MSHPEFFEGEQKQLVDLVAQSLREHVISFDEIMSAITWIAHASDYGVKMEDVDHLCRQHFVSLGGGQENED